MFNDYVSDDKIKQFQTRKPKGKSFSSKNKLAEIKNFLGFEYVKLKKDVNGIRFSEKSLRDFSYDLKYNISLMRKSDEEIFLYQYFISGSELKRFFEEYINGTIEGEIIQIEKYTPENLA